MDVHKIDQSLIVTLAWHLWMCLQPSLRGSLASQIPLDMLSALTSRMKGVPGTTQSMGYSLHALVSGALPWTAELAWHSTFWTGSKRLRMLRTTVVAPLASVRKYCMQKQRQTVLHQNMLQDCMHQQNMHHSCKQLLSGGSYVCNAHMLCSGCGSRAWVPKRWSRTIEHIELVPCVTTF